MGAFISNNFDYFYCCGIQKYLNENAGLTKPISVDGQIGPGTSNALKLLQAKLNLPATGIYDSASQSAIEPAMQAKYVMTSDIQATAKSLGLDVPTVMAVTITESSGAGFLINHQAKILFERHIFYQRAQANPSISASLLSQWVAQFPNVCNPQAGGYSNDATGVMEWQRYNVAALLNQSAAQEAISMGLFQILGENYTFCGYDNVTAYFNAMQQTEKLQLAAFASFITKYLGGKILAALRGHDWATAARYYNGPSQVTSYAAKLALYYQNNIALT